MNASYLLILTIGVFSIINTEMGVIGILPMIAERYGVAISQAGLLVSLFALAVAVSGPVLPLLFSRFNRKYIMVLVLGLFTLCNLVSAFTDNFNVVLVARVLPAFLHPVYVSLAFSVAAASVAPEQAPKAVAKVLVGVSAGMVLGVPVVSYLASITSLEVAMLSFAAVNAIALLATILCVPSLPVKERLTYGSQMQVLKHANVWLALGAVIFLNGAVFGVFSYLAEYLGQITHLPAALVSGALFVYGAANILGNMVGGRLLIWNAARFAKYFPLSLLIVYLLFGFGGSLTWPAFIIIFLWGVTAGAGVNLQQYLITRAAHEAPDFANGLFLVGANIGTSVGAYVCGLLIASSGLNTLLYGGILFIAFSVATIFFLQRSDNGNTANDENLALHA